MVSAATDVRRLQVPSGWYCKIDWLVTLLYLWRGDVTLAQVTTASFLPVIFIAVLWVHFPRGTAAATPPARL